MNEIYHIDFSTDHIDTIFEALDIAASWNKHEKRFLSVKKFIIDAMKNRAKN